jgi:Tfp pilus assembly protein FimV
MPGGPDPNLRLLAPALVAFFAVAALAIVLGSGAVLGGDSTERSAVSGQERGERGSRADRRRARGRSTYTVRAGDTLAGIAQRTGTSVDRLQEVNPNLDPQALSAGQRIRLRE